MRLLFRSSRDLRRAPRCAIVVASLWGCACGDTFDPYERLTGPRILAVRSQLQMLHPGDSSELSALVHLPAGTSAAYQWGWCPITLPRETGYACAVGDDVIAAALAAAGVVDSSIASTDLGRSDTAVFTYPVDASTVRALCLAMLDAGAPLPGGEAQCGVGLEITLRLDVRVSQSTLSAIKRVTLATDVSLEGGANPTITELGLETGAVFPEAEPAQISPGAVPLRALVPVESAEVYTPAALPFESNPVEGRERLRLSWFATAGSFDVSRTAFLEGSVGFSELLSNSWTVAPSDRGRQRIYLVLRDERGGVGWLWRDAVVNGGTP